MMSLTTENFAWPLPKRSIIVMTLDAYIPSVKVGYVLVGVLMTTSWRGYLALSDGKNVPAHNSMPHSRIVAFRLTLLRRKRTSEHVRVKKRRGRMLIELVIEAPQLVHPVEQRAKGVVRKVEIHHTRLLIGRRR